jgi:hypothetical protein
MDTVGGQRCHRRLSARMAQLMRECDAPAEQFERLGLPSTEPAG